MLKVILKIKEVMIYMTILFLIVSALTAFWFISLLIKFGWFFGMLEQDGDSGFPIWSILIFLFHLIVFCYML